MITRRQLRAAGLSDTKIDRWVAEGHLCRQHRSIYTLGHTAITRRGQLLVALFYAGRGSALSHTTAAWWWRLIDPEPRRIHVSALHSGASTRRIKIHSPRELEVVEHRGLPVTTIARTALDIAASLRFGELRRIVAEVEYQERATLDELEVQCVRGRPGSAALRRALSAHRPELARTRSALEERFVALCERHAIPMPELNVTICGFVVDALWREQRLVVELDGTAAHATPARMEADRRRDLTLRAAGYAVQRYTWPQITAGAPAVAADVARALDLRRR